MKPDSTCILGPSHELCCRLLLQLTLSLFPVPILNRDTSKGTKSLNRRRPWAEPLPLPLCPNQLAPLVDLDVQNPYPDALVAETATATSSEHRKMAYYCQFLLAFPLQPDKDFHFTTAILPGPYLPTPDMDT
ncbi:hypothetical protein ACRALDRAFT_205443 [Sodiomyces alcalophilus JCM 7366]|uniref:uncharacterized protein n=1 Tax=Sodiomyces alcalophilus JCM 7366 TaxID=591952 RepID=UPI0039B515FA